MRRLTAVAIACLCATHTLAQPRTTPPRSPVSRTPDGRPDLQGTWSNATLTPLERGPQFLDKEFYSDAEVADLEDTSKSDERLRRARGDVEADTNGENSDAWRERRRIGRDRRTSIIVDPPDGRRPALSPQAQARVDLGVRRQRNEIVPDGPEALGVSERCLLWGANPPLLPLPYNSNFQIVQTQDFIALSHEMIHDVRIAPLDGRPHLPSSVRQWTGDSRAHWDGDTLVVDTANFTDKVFFQGAGAGLHVVERFTREDADTLRYEFTVDDASSFARPWSGRLWMTRTDGRIYEYACHEANYSMPMILRGAQSR